MHFPVSAEELRTVAFSTGLSGFFHWLWHLDWKRVSSSVRDRLSKPVG